MSALIFTVSDLISRVADHLKRDSVLMNVAVEGELSGVTRAASQHHYFTLKDDHAELSAVWFSSDSHASSYKPQAGDRVVCVGRADLYTKKGRFQFVVKTITPCGAGHWYERFLALKAKLEAEGLFADDKKRSLPFWPKRIGVVTSETGAVLSDIATGLRQSGLSFCLMLYPASVQGATAAEEIARAIERANAQRQVDILIVGRGGGSFEDLFAFNEERVVRAIAKSEIPVVSAVGHETDTSLSDWAADRREPTPTAAARAVLPLRASLTRDLLGVARRVAAPLRTLLNQRRLRLDHVADRLNRAHPQFRLERSRQTLDEYAASLSRALCRQTVRARERLNALAQTMRLRRTYVTRERRARLMALTHRLDALSPERVLARGFGLVTTPRGAVMMSAAAARAHERLVIRFYDGALAVRVSAKTPTPPVKEKDDERS